MYVKKVRTGTASYVAVKDMLGALVDSITPK
jgi:hypothetical protein